MKSTLIYICLALCFYRSDSFYTLSIDHIEGYPINMSDYAGRKVMILTFDAASPDSSLLQRADSLQRVDASASILAVPTGDFSGSASDSSLSALHSGLALTIPFTQMVHVTRSTGEMQHPLFKWLTDVVQNKHFDRDVEAPGQSFFVSEQGTLYAILNKDTDASVLLDALHQPINQ